MLEVPGKRHDRSSRLIACGGAALGALVLLAAALDAGWADTFALLVMPAVGERVERAAGELVEVAVAAASNQSGGVGGLLWAATSVEHLATTSNWTQLREQGSLLREQGLAVNWSTAKGTAAELASQAASQANESYSDLAAAALGQVASAAWWLGGWYDTAPQRPNLRERLQSFISLQSSLRGGVAISLSWVSLRENFTIVAGGYRGRKVRIHNPKPISACFPPPTAGPTPSTPRRRPHTPPPPKHQHPATPTTHPAPPTPHR